MQQIELGKLGDRPEAQFVIKKKNQNRNINNMYSAIAAIPPKIAYGN